MQRHAASRLSPSASVQTACQRKEWTTFRLKILVRIKKTSSVTCHRARNCHATIGDVKKIVTSIISTELLSAACRQACRRGRGEVKATDRRRITRSAFSTSQCLDCLLLTCALMTTHSYFVLHVTSVHRCCSFHFDRFDLSLHVPQFRFRNASLSPSHRVL